MLKRRILIPFALLQASLLGGCTTLQLFFQERQYTQDQTITAKIKGALLGDQHLRGLPISVDTYLRVVELKGRVKQPAQAVKAGEIAAATPGVKSVVNNISVE